MGSKNPPPPTEARHSGQSGGNGCVVALLVAFVALWFAGTAAKQYRTKPASRWSVKLVSPSGDVTQSWTVTSVDRPVKGRHWGGHTTLFRSSDRHVWRDIQAPTGWGLKVTRLDRAQR